jgi:hypothetical protein
MTETLAVCARVDAATATLTDWMAELTNFFTSPPATIAFTKNGASTSTALLLDHPDGWQLLIRNDGTNILCSVDPGAAITNLSGVPTGSTSYSGESIVVAPANCGARMYIACYPDAILVGIKHTTSDFWQQGLHAGKLYTPYNASDPAIFIDGFGIIGGSPTINVANSNTWLIPNASNSSTNTGRLRVSQTTWNTTAKCELLTAQGDAGGAIRLNPLLATVGAGTGTSGFPALGFTKYLRRYKSAVAHRTLIPASNTSDQAFMIFSGTTSTTQFCCLWSKAVTP